LLNAVRADYGGHNEGENDGFSRGGVRDNDGPGGKAEKQGLQDRTLSGRCHA
jgi:hypothetical protein